MRRPTGLDDPLALRFSRPVMNSNECKNTKVSAAATKFLAQVSSCRFEPLLRSGVPRLRTGKRNGRSAKKQRSIISPIVNGQVSVNTSVKRTKKHRLPASGTSGNIGERGRTSIFTYFRKSEYDREIDMRYESIFCVQAGAKCSSYFTLYLDLIQIRSNADACTVATLGR